jgi:hypothetical protein
MRGKMNLEGWLKSGIEYGWDLLRSAVEGARSAEEQIREEESPGSVLRRSALISLAPTVAAASLGLAAGYLVSRRKSAHRTAAFGLAGALIGFAAGMAWSTRRITGDLARGAKKKVDATRNAHWLAKHPVDYA